MATYDDIDVDQLRSAGSVKWTAFPEAIGAFVAEMDFGVAPPVLAALHAAVDRMGFGYLTPALAREVSAACAHWQQERYGWSVHPESVHPVGDVLQALELTMTFFSPVGAPLVLPTPAYMPFLALPPLLGRQVVQVPMVRDAAGRLVHDLPALEQVFDRLDGALFVLTNPHNPGGTVATRAELTELSALVDRYDVRVFADEVHAPLVYAGSTHVPYASVSDAAARHSVTATSASKAWNVPGLKCAQLILTADADAQRWAEVAFLGSLGVSTLGAAASVAAYTEGGPWLDETLEYLDGNRQELATLLAEHLPAAACRAPDGTYLAWLDCRALDLEEGPGGFFHREAGVALVDGIACGEVGAGHVRLNFATPRPVLRELVVRMGSAVRDRRG